MHLFYIEKYFSLFIHKNVLIAIAPNIKCREVVMMWSGPAEEKIACKALRHLLPLFSCLYKAFRHVETLFVQGRNLVPSRPTFGWWKLSKPRQPIVILLGTRFLHCTNNIFTCQKALFSCLYLPRYPAVGNVGTPP